MKKARFLLAVITLVWGNMAFAEAIKNSEFMKLSEGQRHWWYAGAYTTLGHLASLEGDETKSKCVWHWFFDDPEKRKAQLEKSFALYPDHAPTSIVISLIRRDCNAFLEKGNRTD